MDVYDYAHGVTDCQSKNLPIGPLGRDRKMN